MPNALNNVQSAVIDTESVAWDTELKTILPFQILTTRKVSGEKNTFFTEMVYWTGSKNNLKKNENFNFDHGKSVT